MSTDRKPEALAITADTRVNLAIVVLLLGGVVTLTGLVVSVKLQISNMQEEQYTVSAASENALREAMMNPGHRMPDPRNPGEHFVVERALVTRNE